MSAGRAASENANLFPLLSSQLWKKHYAIDGQVTQHLSPFEQNIVSPMFKDVHTKVFKKLYEMALEAGPGLVAGIVLYNWCEATHKSIAFHHRH